MPDTLPRLALTLGDCAGIGPELTLRALADPAIAQVCRLIVFGNHTILSRVSAQTGIPLPSALTLVSADIPQAHAPQPTAGHVLVDESFPEAQSLSPGIVQQVCGSKAFDWIRSAVEAIGAGEADALVTAPINKEALHLAGVPFPGHTEMLAHLTGAAEAPCMAFHAPGLFISLATIHEALASVPRILSVEGLSRTIRLTHEACLGFCSKPPRIGVLALNPHAGEHGLFGNEEQSVIEPAIRRARAEGMNISGPLVPDTAFTGLASRQPLPFDAYVAMYHDQGLIPFKMVAFDTGVNVTLGLPIIRTSPDHGTAFNIAWQGEASPESLFCAIRLAARMASGRKAPLRADA